MLSLSPRLTNAIRNTAEDVAGYLGYSYVYERNVWEVTRRCKEFHLPSAYIKSQPDLMREWFLLSEKDSLSLEELVVEVIADMVH